MATAIIRMITKNNKRQIIIEYHGDADMLPFEHEEEHRKLVNKLIEGGMMKAEEVNDVVVERVAGNEGVIINNEENVEREGIKQNN